MAPARRSGRGTVKNIIVRALIALTAVVGLATPASAAVDLDIKRAIVEVVLDNLGVEASDEFVASVADELDATELNGDLVSSVGDLLDADGDPRDVIETFTDANGDGVPDEGAAESADDDERTPNPNSTEKSSNSDDKSGNSSNRNPNGTNNSGNGRDEEETEEEEVPEDEEESEEEESEDEDDD